MTILTASQDNHTLTALTADMLADVPHGFFTRQGGVSSSIYASLNVAYGSRDNREAVQENRKRITEGFFGLPEAHLLTLKQVHSNICITVEDAYDAADAPEADALVTDRHGLILGVLTADCVPVLLYDERKGIIGAAHAGWKGALIGIVQATVQAMCALGSHAADIKAATGASIAQASYEVDAAFVEQFLAQDESNARFFLPSTAHPVTHFQFDNKAYVREQLLLSGVQPQHIETLPQDTYAEETDYFSFRRATHRGEVDYGRQLSAIML